MENTNNLTKLISLNSSDWYTQSWELDTQQRLYAVETGNVLFFPKLSFVLSTEEHELLNPDLTDPKQKNISLDPNTQKLHGLKATPIQKACAYKLINRYQQQVQTLITNLFPHYREKLHTAPTSLRLHRVETRSTSWRKDDTRLHIDAFPSRPNHGERILRIFSNISPTQEPRVWRIGAHFEKIAQQFLPRTKQLPPGAAWLMYRLGITKRRRSEYDQLMLQLHDAMKYDMQYQMQGLQATVPFPAGSVWICYSDQVPHAVMSGQFMLEQTYFLAPEHMRYPEHAPLSVLSRMLHRQLI